MSRIQELTVVELAHKIRTGELTCVQMVSQFIENISNKKHLNALTYFNQKNLLEEAKRKDEELSQKGPNGVGRLHGVPLVVKDNIHVKGIPNTAACPGLKDFVPIEDAPVIKSLREAGAIIIAKANMHELAFGTTSQNACYGFVRCACNADYSAGGSSGGTGAAVGSGQAPAGLGTDTGGSVRMPSSINGICGLRPSTGRYSQIGITPLSASRDTAGPMAHSCQDLELLDEIITGEKFIDKTPVLTQLKIGIPKGYLTADLDPEVEKVFDNFKQVLKQAGCDLIEVDMTQVEILDNQLGVILVFYECGRDLAKYLVDNKIPMTLEELAAKIESPDVKMIFENSILEGAPNSIKPEIYEKSVNEVRPRLIEEYKLLFDKYQIDLIAYPTLMCLPPKADDLNATVEYFDPMVRNNSPASNAGLPSLTIPVGRSTNELPVGVTLDALFNRDQFLLRSGALVHKLFK